MKPFLVLLCISFLAVKTDGLCSCGGLTKPPYANPSSRLFNAHVNFYFGSGSVGDRFGYCRSPKNSRGCMPGSACCAIGQRCETVDQLPEEIGVQQIVVGSKTQNTVSTVLLDDNCRKILFNPGTYKQAGDANKALKELNLDKHSIDLVILTERALTLDGHVMFHSFSDVLMPYQISDGDGLPFYHITFIRRKADFQPLNFPNDKQIVTMINGTSLGSVIIAAEVIIDERDLQELNPFTASHDKRRSFQKEILCDLDIDYIIPSRGPAFQITDAMLYRVCGKSTTTLTSALAPSSTTSTESSVRFAQSAAPTTVPTLEAEPGSTTIQHKNTDLSTKPSSQTNPPTSFVESFQTTVQSSSSNTASLNSDSVTPTFPSTVGLLESSSSTPDDVDATEMFTGSQTVSSKHRQIEFC